MASANQLSRARGWIWDEVQQVKTHSQFLEPKRRSSFTSQSGGYDRLFDDPRLRQECLREIGAARSKIFANVNGQFPGLVSEGYMVRLLSPAFVESITQEFIDIRDFDIESALPEYPLRSILQIAERVNRVSLETLEADKVINVCKAAAQHGVYGIMHRLLPSIREQKQAIAEIYGYVAVNSDMESLMKFKESVQDWKLMITGDTCKKVAAENRPAFFRFVQKHRLLSEILPSDWREAVIIAARDGSIDVLEELASPELRHKIEESDWGTAFLSAVETNQRESVRFFSQQKLPHMFSSNRYFEDAVERVVQGNNIELLGVLMKSPNINHMSSGTAGRAYCYSVRNKQVKMSRLLEEKVWIVLACMDMNHFSTACLAAIETQDPHAYVFLQKRPHFAQMPVDALQDMLRAAAMNGDDQMVAALQSHPCYSGISSYVLGDICVQAEKAGQTNIAELLKGFRSLVIGAGAAPQSDRKE